MSQRTLAQWLDWQSSLHPRNIELGLQRVNQVWQALGAPAPASCVVSVAGTNGKGSSVAMLESVLRHAGYRVGAYTSPHLLRYNERVRVDAEPISDAELCAAFEQIERARGEVALTYFEFGTLAALLCFSHSELDLAILEVGLGGRLDAVNIIDADVALITGIGLDHTDWLGNTLEQIGYEKAGILRPDRPAVFGALQMPQSIQQHADAIGANLVLAGQDFRAEQQPGGWRWVGRSRTRSALPLPNLRGAVQLQNAAAVVQVLEFVGDRFPVDQQALKAGLLDAQVKGRLQVEQRSCRWVLDVAHNPQAAAHLAAQMADLFVPGQTHAVVGMLADKAIEEVMGLLSPRVDRWHLLDLSDQPRGASAQRLYAGLPEEHRQHARLIESPETYLAELEQQLGTDDQILVFGSFLSVGAVMHWMQDTPVAGKA